MNPLYLAAVNVRATLMTPLRHARLRRLAAQSQSPLSVLFYHRVADSDPTPWTITGEQFRRHVDYCSENFELIDLAEVQRQSGSGTRLCLRVCFRANWVVSAASAHFETRASRAPQRRGGLK